jgi:hexosaminidase
MRALGIQDPAELQPYFTQRLERFLEAHGRRLVGWDEILEPGLGSTAVVMSWRGTDGALHAARKGHDTVVAAHPTLYFDHRQGTTRDEPPGRVKVVSLRDVYLFDPMPAGLDREEARHVLGIQGNVWTEHIRTEERASIMAFPRAAAIAERGWSSTADWMDFRARMGHMLSLYPALGLAEAARLESLRQDVPPSPPALKRTSAELALCSDHIAIALEDDAPREGPRAILSMDIQNPCWLWRAAPLERARAIRARVGQVPFNFQIGDEVKKISFPVPATPEGELQVRRGSCDGELLAAMPLRPAQGRHATTDLPAAPLPRMESPGDLCLRFAQRGVDPLWAIDEVELMESLP